VEIEGIDREELNTLWNDKTIASNAAIGGNKAALSTFMDANCQFALLVPRSML
jgi:hypothetical protein